ncbi:ethylmalonyl-CoA decarboxylase isoform X3 [Meriones unguiculatus]|uniref:ethylmalonyl-CoA decarboxylase isoform X3 n=1 Tax=Meriones unguiculatus TaxID=10047 RepID=UPI00293E1594|nr:ethylmalonyl-CoA decarboxylase isoform X3 [Meriones unguiculatus]
MKGSGNSVRSRCGGGRGSRAAEEMAKSLLTSSLSVRTKLLQTGVSLYNTSHGFHEEEVKKILAQYPGGTIDLQKKEDGIGILTLNNPNKLNAFSGVMMLQLLERVTELENWTEGKGLIVHGAKNTFCSGSDLNAVKALSTPETTVNKCCSDSRLGNGWRSRIYYSM